MDIEQERILVVEGDHQISDLISRQTLKPLGYQVKVIHDAPSALQEVKRFLPDIMIVNLNLPGLSGKDLLVALSSQRINIPVIIIAREGMEKNVIQAFRLGAIDYLGWPIREAEIVSAVERALVQVREQREREIRIRNLEKSTKELQVQVHDLSIIEGIGKTITSITDRQDLVEKIVEGAIFITDADKGWLLLRGDEDSSYKLYAQKNLPKSIIIRKDTPWDDGISSLVAASGDTLSIHGSSLKLLKISQFCRSALLTPIKINNEPVGIIAVAKDAPTAFEASKRPLIEALAGFSSIALLNSERFENVEKRALSLIGEFETSRKGSRLRSEILSKLIKEMDSSLSEVIHKLDSMANDRENPIIGPQADSLNFINEHTKRAQIAVDGFRYLYEGHDSSNMSLQDIVELANQSTERLQSVANEYSVEIVKKIPKKPVFSLVDSDQIEKVFDSLIMNAIKVSSGGFVELSILQDKMGNPHVTIRDTGPGIPEDTISKIFDPFFMEVYDVDEVQDHKLPSFAIVQEMVKAHGGKMWVESRLNIGTIFHFTLKPAVL
jgi:FixJ family two-component response regulator